MDFHMDLILLPVYGVTVQTSDVFLVCMYYVYIAGNIDPTILLVG